MNTGCTAKRLAFHGLGRRKVVGGFNGGEISSDGGGLLLREVVQRTHILRRLSARFTDHRDPTRIEHELETLIKQRVFGLALGYEDLVDHDELCRGRLLALLCGCTDLGGSGRVRASNRGKPLAGKSALNQFELTPTRWHNTAISRLTGTEQRHGGKVHGNDNEQHAPQCIQPC